MKQRKQKKFTLGQQDDEINLRPQWLIKLNSGQAVTGKPTNNEDKLEPIAQRNQKKKTKKLKEAKKTISNSPKTNITSRITHLYWSET